MSRDRLRDLRSQQQQTGNAGYGAGPTGYGQAQPGGYGNQYGGGYGQQQQQPTFDSYGNNNGPSYGYPPAPAASSGLTGTGPIDMQQFFAEVGAIQDDIKRMNQNISHISELHARRLATTDDQYQSSSAAELSQMTTSTTQLTNSIRNRISALNEANKKRSQPGEPEFQQRKNQIAALQTSFRSQLEEYNSVEKRSRDKYRQRMERQIRIVKPDATQEEIRAAFDNSTSGQQIFSQALMSSRQAGARQAFAEVQSRNQDLQKIEQTITELAQMMQDMATLVLEQDTAVQAIETNAVNAQKDVESGLQQTKKAVVSARRARKLRWACFMIILVIIIVVVVVVVVETVGKKN